LFWVFASLMVTKAISEDNVATACSRWYAGGSELDISCPLGKVVSVTKAFYGFWKDSSGTCSYSRNDCTSDAMHVAVDVCRGKTSCRVPVSTSLASHVLGAVLDIPSECATWNDRHDYLQVFYKCTDVPDDFGYTASECTHFYTVNEELPHPILTEAVAPLRNHLDIQCPQDKVISVTRAFYGWWKNNLNQGCRFHTEDCRIDNPVASRLCNGSNTCRIPVDRSNVSPRCGQPIFELKIDHFDYYQVDYTCKPERK